MTQLELQEKIQQDLYKDFEAIAMPFRDLLYNFALKMTGNTEDAADLVQETYMKAFRFFDKFERGTNIKAWLFRILKNSFINDYRKVAKEPNKVDYDDVQNFYETIKATEVTGTHTEEDAFANGMGDEVTSALADLPEDFRTVIILSDIEGFTYEEIADFVDIPVGTVRSRLHRARKVLYANLYDYASNKGIISE